MRETSLEAYEFLKNSGALTAMQDRVVATLAHAGPYNGDLGIAQCSRTASELAREMKLPRDSVSPRLAELRRRGLVKEAETRECMVTGHTTNAFVIASPDEVRDAIHRKRGKVTPRKKLQELVRRFETALAECKTEGREHRCAEVKSGSMSECRTEDGDCAFAGGDVNQHALYLAHKRLRAINQIVETALMGAQE